MGCAVSALRVGVGLGGEGFYPPPISNSTRHIATAGQAPASTTCQGGINWDER